MKQPDTLDPSHYQAVRRVTTIVLFSGGVGSWAAARRLADAGEPLLLLFTDTKTEDANTYRFLRENASVAASACATDAGL